VPLGLDNTISISLCRRKSPVVDGPLDPETGLVPIKPNGFVMRGPDWSAGNEDGGEHCIGTVLSIDEGSVSVKWAAATKTYTYTAEKREILPADLKLGGHIYSKGAANLYEVEDDAPKIPSWGVFGLRLLSSGLLNVFIANTNGDPLSYSSKTVCPYDDWVNATVVQAKTGTSRLYINGVLNAEYALPSFMYSADSGASEKIIESPHPYSDNMDTYETVEFPGASKLSVSFDPLSRTEDNCDYIIFYKDDSHSTYWGESKYHGGRNGTANFPTAARPLIIDSSKFVFYFHSDGGVNDYGYKITVKPVSTGTYHTVHIYIYIHIYTYTYIYIYTYTHTYTYTHIHTYTYIYTHIHIHIYCTHIHIYIYIHIIRTYTYTHIYIYIHIYTYTYTYTYILYTYTHKHIYIYIYT
jgi:hypothetical protein